MKACTKCKSKKGFRMNGVAKVDVRGKWGVKQFKVSKHLSLKLPKNVICLNCGKRILQEQAIHLR